MTETIKYVRDDKGRPYATLFGYFYDNTKTIKIGWSMCNRKYDTFVKDEGRHIAALRARTASKTAEIPQTLTHEFVQFRERCARRYKTYNFYTQFYTYITYRVTIM